MARHKGERQVARLAFGLVIASFLLSTCVSLASLHVISKRNVREMNKVLTTQIYDYITAEIARPMLAARTMASNSYLIDALRAEGKSESREFARDMADYIAGVERALGYQRGFVVSCGSLDYYTRDGHMRTIDPASEQDAWYAAFMADDASFDLDVDTDELNKSDLTLYVNAKIADTDRAVLGICGVGVRMTGIQDLFRTFEESFAVKIDLVDPTGLVQVDTVRDNIESVDLSNMIQDVRGSDYVYKELGRGQFAITKYVEDLDWYLVVQSKRANELGQYASVILLNIILCALVLVALLIALRLNRRHTDELKSASLVDHMTGLGNKRAFEMERSELAAHPLDVDLLCVTADVNGLKLVNDGLGHEAGDELIRGAADCLRGALGRFGHVYRTGGDEFSALLHATAGDVDEIRRELGQMCGAWSGRTVTSLALSCGFCGAWEYPDADLDELIKVSDERMYEDKERYYERTGATRR